MKKPSARTSARQPPANTAGTMPVLFVGHGNRMWVSTPAGTWTEPETLRRTLAWAPLDNEDWPCGAVLGDLNRDMRPDLVLGIHGDPFKLVDLGQTKGLVQLSQRIPNSFGIRLEPFGLEQFGTRLLKLVGMQRRQALGHEPVELLGGMVSFPDQGFKGVDLFGQRRVGVRAAAPLQKE